MKNQPKSQSKLPVGARVKLGAACEIAKWRGKLGRVVRAPDRSTLWYKIALDEQPGAGPFTFDRGELVRVAPTIADLEEVRRG